MAKSSRKKKGGPPRPGRRVNFKAVAILGGLLLACVIGYFPIRKMTDVAARRSALEQVRASIEAKDVDMAIRRLDRFMAAWPGDLEGLRIQAKLMADAAQTPDQVIAAANLNDKLLRVDPEGPESQATRRRLVELYVRYGYEVRRGGQARREEKDAAKEVRYRAAVAISRQYLARAAKDDPNGQRLLAMALDGLAGGDASAVEEAINHYKQALQIDPGDIESARGLAKLYLVNRNSPVAGEQVLDALLKAKPNDPDVRMTRYQLLVAAKQPERARAELEAAAKLAPNNSVVLKTLAIDSLQNRDPESARRSLDAIPAADQNSLEIRTLRGELEFAEQNPEAGFDQWRKGLTLAGGSDLDLTWRLASALIRTNRLSEAKPLVAQFERLASENQEDLARYLRALFELQQGHTARAIDSLEKIRDRVPESLKLEVQLLLGQCYERMGDMTKAMQTFRRAAMQAPMNATPRREVARLLKQTEPVQALAELEEALRVSPDTPELLIEIAQLRFQRQMALPAADRRWNDVDQIIGRLDKVAPANSTAQKLKANLLIASGRAGEAVEMLAEATKGPGRNRAETWVDYAAALERQGRRELALKALDEGARPELAGDHASIRIAKAMLLARSGRGQAARELLTDRLGTVPKSERPDLCRMRGELARALGDRPGAREAYADWARLQPDSPRPGMALLELAGANDDDDAARLGLEALKAIGGEQEPYGLASRAIELIRVDRNRKDPTAPEKLEEAERLAERLEKTAPQLAIGPLIRGQIHIQKKQYPEAALAFRKALKDPAITSIVLPQLIDVLVRLGKSEELVQLRKTYGEAEKADSFDRTMAQAALRNGDQEQAEVSARQLAAANPDDPQMISAVAGLLHERKKTAEGHAMLDELVARRPNDAAAWINLIQFEARTGPAAEAARTVERLRASYRGERPDLVYARALRLSGNIEAAAKAYDAAVGAHPDDVSTVLVAIEFDEATGRVAQSEAAFRQFLKANPKTSWAARGLAGSLSNRADNGAWNEAWALVAPGAPGWGDDPEDRLVRISLQLKNPDAPRRVEAVPDLMRLARDLSPTNVIGAEARIRMAQLMLENFKTAEAAEFIAPVVDLQGAPNPTALAIGIEAQARSGQLDQAERRLERLAAIEPKSPRTAASRAWILGGRGKLAEADAIVEAAVAEALSTPNAELLALGFRSILAKLGRAEAVDRLDLLVASKLPKLAYLAAQYQAHHGQFAEALANCRVAADSGSSTEAVRVAATVVMAKPDDLALHKQVDALLDSILPGAPKATEMLVALAMIRHIEGRYDDEVATYRDALESSPSTFRFLNNMAWTLSEGLKKPEEALPKVDDAIRREKRVPAYLDTRGVVLTRLGRFDEAIADLKESIVGAAGATTYYHLAKAYFKAGKPDEQKKARDLANRAGFDRSKLDATDRGDLEEVMGPP